MEVTLVSSDSFFRTFLLRRLLLRMLVQIAPSQALWQLASKYFRRKVCVRMQWYSLFFNLLLLHFSLHRKQHVRLELMNEFPPDSGLFIEWVPAKSTPSFFLFLFYHRYSEVTASSWMRDIFIEWARLICFKNKNALAVYKTCTIMEAYACRLYDNGRWRNKSTL